MVQDSAETITVRFPWYRFLPWYVAYPYYTRTAGAQTTCTHGDEIEIEKQKTNGPKSKLNYPSDLDKIIKTPKTGSLCCIIMLAAVKHAAHTHSKQQMHPETNFESNAFLLAGDGRE